VALALALGYGIGLGLRDSGLGLGLESALTIFGVNLKLKKLVHNKLIIIYM